MDFALWLGSWSAAVASLAVFAGLAMYALVLRRRARSLPEGSIAELERRRVTEIGALGAVAGALGVALQLSFMPFYACSLLGHTVRGEIAHVKRTARGSYRNYTADAVYVDASGGRHWIAVGGTRQLYEDCAGAWPSCGAYADFVVVDGAPWLAQMGSRPTVPGLAVVAAGASCLLLFIRLRQRRVPRSIAEREPG